MKVSDFQKRLLKGAIDGGFPSTVLSEPPSASDVKRFLAGQHALEVASAVAHAIGPSGFQTHSERIPLNSRVFVNIQMGNMLE